MPSPHSDTANHATEASLPILVRVGEIFLKGKNRGTFLNRLARNIRRAVSDIEGVSVEPLHLRPVVWHPASKQREVMARLARVFGVHSMSPATPVEPNIEAITATAMAIAKGLPEGETFKIEAKRKDKTFPIRSQQLCADIGARIHLEHGRPVDVRTPQHRIRIEIGRRRSFVFSDWTKGPGGLPIGVSAPLTLLLSGGIDSPVAGYSAMRRGCPLNAVYFHSFPYTGDKTKDKVLRLAAHLARWQGRMAVHVVHFTEAQKRIRDQRRQDLVVLLYRRMMMRVACAIAEREGSKALVTGENLGQVASQTLENLAAIQAVSTLPILRPLVALDKEEIIEKARAIGTFETSIEPYEDSCSLFIPKNPATRARAADLDQAEAELDVASTVASLVEGAERIVVG